jgi:hypothetical protein
VGEEKEVPYSN